MKIPMARSMRVARFAVAAAAGFAAVVFVCLTAAPALAQQCSAAAGGAPCETASGVASLGDPDGSDLTVGNPIHPVTGNKYQEEIDSPPLPGALGLEIRRHFNSSYTAADSAWGRGWALSYDTRLYRVGATLQIVQADGRRVIFGVPEPGGPAVADGPFGPLPVATCTSLSAGQGRLLIEPDGYRWIWPQQRELHFDGNGRLARISPPDGGAGESVQIARDETGRITQVTDPAGRSMKLSYDLNGRLAQIDHPLGQWRYRIDASGRIERLQAPDGLQRRYRYEDIGHRFHMTAIAVAAAGQAEQIVGQWAYDVEGRATLYRRGDGGELRMAYRREDLARAPGEVVSVLINALGGSTTFRAVEIGGRWRVTEIAGPGCEECGPGNARMHYDGKGQVLARWKIGGKGVHYQRDPQGRVIRLTEISDHGLAAGADGMIPIVSPGAKLLQRFEYPDELASSPSVVARPSVVPGHEHRILIERDERGNVIALTEAGHAPAVTATGPTAAVAASVAITRTVRLRYEEIGGRRVLAEMDGPLPNGPLANPSDSDITRFTHDDGGRFLVAVETPGGAVRRFVSRDAAGRPVVITSADGFRAKQEELDYSLDGLVVSSRLSGWLLDAGGNRIPRTRMQQQLSRRYDPQGRLIRVVDRAGRVTAIDRDGAGRLAGVSDAQGFRSALERDREGRVRVAGLYQPGSEEYLRAAYYGRNPQGRLQSLLLPDGRRLAFHYNRSGEAIGYTDADRILRLALPSARGPDSGSNVVDDFGQILKQELPDHGATTRRFDEAGRLTYVIDAAGAWTAYRYDAANRLLQATSAGGADTVSYDYEGDLLVAVDDPAQATRHVRDALGRVVQTRTRLTGLPREPLVVSRSYDRITGLVDQRGLADGWSIQVVRGSANEGGNVRHLRLRSAFWTSLATLLQRLLPADLARRVTSLLPASRIASDIEVHPFDGLVGFTHGNGIRMQRRFDPAGRTSRLRAAGIGNQLITDWRYGYGTGTRIRSIEQLAPASATKRADAAASRRQGFAYDSSGALKMVAEGIGPAPAPGRAAGSASGGASGRTSGSASDVELDHAGRVVRDARFRYSYTRHGQLKTVKHLGQDRTVADYAYNYLRQRTMKRVYDEAGGIAQTVFYLWIDGQLVAEVDPAGTIRTQYLSLNDGRRTLPIAKLERDSDGKVTLLAIHSDHRGAPVAMTGAAKELVWGVDLAPSGEASVHPMTAGSVLNLRLPGQYWDAETGLHDNWHRTYDPRSGRYLQPDPLGYPGGPDAYRYAGGDPINRIDPAGLYEIDVHYYMTFFLGVTAGLDLQEARIVALAAQYVDNNPLTRPVDSTDAATMVGSVWRNQQQLLSYHFVLSGADGRVLPEFRNSRLSNGSSPQLQNLLNAAHSDAVGRNGTLQFLGEYLHALADTYSHRDSNNLPYDALFANCGLGHGHALHEPDLTYDDIHHSPNPGVEQGQPPSRESWRREARTLEMELNLHGVLLAYGDPAKAKAPRQIEAVLREFNAIRESEGQGRSTDFPVKIGLLQRELDRLGYGEIDLSTLQGFAYDVERAAENRRDFLRGQSGEELTEEAFPGVCLEGGRRCTAG